MDRRIADLVEGKPSELALKLSEIYEETNLPRHPKKAVEGSRQKFRERGLMGRQALLQQNFQRLPSTWPW